MMACATPRVPSANGASSNTPIGPFQNTVFALASTCANASTDSGPMSRPFHPSGIFSTGTVRVFASAENSSATTTSTGSTILPDSQQTTAVVDLVGLQQRVTHPEPLRRQEGEAHPATHQQRVDLRQQRLDDQQLVRHLRPAEHHRVGPLRVVGQLAQHLDLGEHQPARVRRQLTGQVVDRGLLAVHDPEPVGDEDALRPGQHGELAGQRGPLAVVLAGLPRVEADVLQQHHTARGQRSTAAFASSPCCTRATSVPSSDAQPGRDRGQRELRVVRTRLRAAEVGGDDDPRTGPAQPLQRGQRRTDPPVVGDGRTVERDVEVGAHEHAPTLRRIPVELGDQIVEGLHSLPLDATSAVRSTSRLL